MGQAKRRGTYEQRKADAIEDNKKTARLLHEQEVAWWNSLTEEEQANVRLKRAKRAKAMATMGLWMGASHVLGGVGF